LTALRPNRSKLGTRMRKANQLRKGIFVAVVLELLESELILITAIKYFFRFGEMVSRTRKDFFFDGRYAGSVDHASSLLFR
jgi:hypothetical protein